MSVRSDYGFTKAEYDQALFYNRREFRVIWEGTLVCGATGKALLIEGKYRGLYIPVDGRAFVNWKIFCHDSTNNTMVGQYVACGTVINNAGTITYTATTAVTADFGAGTVIAPTANSTTDCLEILVSDANTTQTVHVVVIGEFVNIDVNATGSSRLPTVTLGATTVAE